MIYFLIITKYINQFSKSKTEIKSYINNIKINSNIIYIIFITKKLFIFKFLLIQIFL